MRRVLTEKEMKQVKGYEALTLTSVLTVLAISLLVSITYRFFVTARGSASLPGGFNFTWGK